MAAMMAAAHDLDHGFDDHPSIAASLEDFEEQERRSPLFGIPSQHSGFKSENDGSEMDDQSSAGAPWSPPGFRNRNTPGNAWFREDPYGRFALRPPPSASRSRHTSPEYEDAREPEELTLAANIPLPRDGTVSPMKERSPEPEFKTEKEQYATPEPEEHNQNNYIRFHVRAEVQHREPFVPIMNFLNHQFDRFTSTKSTALTTVVMLLFSTAFLRILFLPPPPTPVPDLVKLSTLAKAFEPLIFYSENGYTQITQLQETSVAVWDLGESVRLVNMTSAPLIVSSLDTLSDTLKTLSLELTRFFASVDADVDGILIVMDWARRELSSLNHAQAHPSILVSSFDRLHTLLNRFPPHLLESPLTLQPTPLGQLVNTIFGQPTPTKTRNALIRTFHELLSVLEDSINTELTHSTALFTLFEAIDRQFLNLQRTVVRETDTQERLESDLLSSLWTRVIGPNAGLLKKFEKNKQLLGTVRARTVANKGLIMEHHGRLQTLKVGLETLRRKLVSPLIVGNNSVGVWGELLPGRGGGRSAGMVGSAGTAGGSTSGVIEGQIKGLEGTYEYLKQVREKQKGRLMEMVYGAGNRRESRLLVGVDEEPALEGRR